MNYELYGDEKYSVVWDGLQTHCIETKKYPFVELGDIFVTPAGVAIELPPSLE